MIDADPPSEVEIQIPPKPEYVRTVRQAVAALARLHGADDDVVEDIKLAVSEACTTALNANTAAAVEPVEVRAGGGPEGLVVEVVDRWTALSHDVAGHPSEISTEELPFESALSLPIVRGLVDEVALASVPGGGARLRMVVSLEPQVDSPSRSEGE